jgi:hypothetical protein
MSKSYIPVKIRRKVLARDNYRCVWCGKKEEHDVGHFIQKQSGGATSEGNIITQCKVCKRKRHYNTPSEFIDKLKLEELEVFREAVMRVKIIRPNGEEIEGEVENLPNPNTKAFYLKYSGDGMQELIFVEPGMRIIQLGTKEKK